MRSFVRIAFWLWLNGAVLLQPLRALQLTATWDSTTKDISGFKVERSTNGLVFTEIATVAANATSYTDSGLAAGTYWYRVRASSGATLSDYSNVLSYQAVDAAPVFVVSPTSQSVATGGSATLSVVVSGSPTPTLQWYKNSTQIAGATSDSLWLSNVSAADAADYSVVATNSLGSRTSSVATVSVTSSSNGAPTNSSTSRLVNASIRAVSGPGEQILIVGFVVSGGTKSVLLRGLGPALASYMSAAVFTDPKLTLFDGSQQILSNDNWGGTSALKAAFATAGASALPDNSADAALVTTLNNRPYTFQIGGSGNGTALAEIYDLNTGTGRLVNIAARAQIDSGDNVLIAGFVIAGSGPKQVLVRAIGPGLAALGVSGALARPQLDLYQGSTRLQHNEEWGGGADLIAAFQRTGAFALPDTASKDAALLVTLPPGAYTAVVSGANATTGVALVEVYEVP